MSNYWIVQLVLPLAAVVAAVFGFLCLMRGRDRLRRVRANDIHVFALIAGLGFEGLVRDATGIHGHPRQWGGHAAGLVTVLPTRESEWCEQLFTDGRFKVGDGPALPGGWSRMTVPTKGRMLLSQAGLIVQGDRLASRRHVRAVHAVERVDHAA